MRTIQVEKESKKNEATTYLCVYLGPLISTRPSLRKSKPTAQETRLFYLTLIALVSPSKQSRLEFLRQILRFYSSATWSLRCHVREELQTF